jgi:hypothetical protein
MVFVVDCCTIEKAKNDAAGTVETAACDGNSPLYWARELINSALRGC